MTYNVEFVGLLDKYAAIWEPFPPPFLGIIISTKGGFRTTEKHKVPIENITVTAVVLMIITTFTIVDMNCAQKGVFLIVTSRSFPEKHILWDDCLLGYISSCILLLISSVL